MSDKVKDLILEADKKFGKGSLKFGNDAIANVPIICSTGSLKMDQALGCGGVPQGRIIEYFGPPSGGKTTLSIITMIECQKAYPDKIVAFIDLENSFDREWATNLGLDCSRVLFSQPDSGAEAFELLEMMIKTDEVSFVVVDSVGGLLTQAQLESGYDEAQMAQLARLMSQSLPKIINAVKGRFCTIVFINQIRNAIGGYGNPEITQGGEALRFWASIRAEVRRGQPIGDKEEPVGFVTKIKIVKNKVGPPFRKIETELYVGPTKYGIDKVGEIVDLAIVKEIIAKTGGWYKFEEQDLRWQGRENVVKYVNDTPDFYNLIVSRITSTALSADVPVAGSFNDLTKKLVSVPDAVDKPKRGRKKSEGEPIILSEPIEVEGGKDESENPSQES